MRRAPTRSDAYCRWQWADFAIRRACEMDASYSEICRLTDTAEFWIDRVEALPDDGTRLGSEYLDARAALQERREALRFD
jgi:hypothetical protein